MGLFLKEKCIMCGTKFYPRHCCICRLREFQLCNNCHNHSTHHRMERAKIGVR